MVGHKICFNRQRWLIVPTLFLLPYFFGYKTIFFHSKNLDTSYKTDLDHWDCLERVKLVV